VDLEGKRLSDLVFSLSLRVDIPVLVLPGRASFVLAVVVLWTSVSLAAQARWSLARLCLVVGQHVVGVLPLGILVHQIAFLVQGIQSISAIQGALCILQGLQLFYIIDRWALVLHSVGKGAVKSVLDAVPAAVGVVDAHACLIVAQVVAPLGVASSAV